jgi:hypothetical protein
MTTRAGFVGILIGLIATVILYPLFIAWPEAFLSGSPAGFSASGAWIAAVVAMTLILTDGGFWAARRSGSVEAWRCASLGALASGLAGTIVFCLWGAAVAGAARWVLPETQSIPQIEFIRAIICRTMGAFLALFLGGSGLGALGGWSASCRYHNQVDTFNKTDPQMAVNAAITAELASILAVALAAGVFPRLLYLLTEPEGQAVSSRILTDMPVEVALLLVLVSQFALTLIVPHETRQAEHRPGMDEMKMAAYVSIGAAPLQFVFLLLIDRGALLNPLVMIALLASTVMSLISLLILFQRVLPRRASFPIPSEDYLKREVKWFGSVPKSNERRLLLLCTGCGLVMALPLYIPVFSVLVNLNACLAGSNVHGVAWKLFMTQAAVSVGFITVIILALISMYMFYLNLGRWFSKWNAQRNLGKS